MFSEITQERWRRFKGIRRAYISLIILSGAFFLSIFSEAIANDKPIYIHYEGRSFFPLIAFHSGREFGQPFDEEADYPVLRYDEAFRDRALWISTPIPHSPNTANLDQVGTPPYGPNLSRGHWLGTDRLGRDLFARLLYGFRLCMLFSLTLMIISAFLGVVIGGVQGYLGGKTDIVMQRLIEVWSALPFLYVVILIGSIYGRNFAVLIFVMSLFSWIGLSYYMRGEFLKMRDQTYVRVARALGFSGPRIFFRQILPNALTPVITILPFTLIGGIASLTALDFLGFGLPPPTPSWGELLQQGLDVIREHPRITVVTTIALFNTLMLATFIGEGVREVFDPRSRQRVE
jgi:microcin C transport system permease protein